MAMSVAVPPPLAMSNLKYVTAVAASLAGIYLGLFVVFSVVTERQWLEKEFFRFPGSFNSRFLNRLQWVWLGIVLVIVFGGALYLDPRQILATRR